MEEQSNKGLTCPVTGCPIKQVFLTILLVFAVSFGFDFLYHGMFMTPYYEATASLWRTEAEMQERFIFCIINHLIFSAGVASLYCWISKTAACGGKCIKTGLKYGLLLGIILGINDFSSYIWLPVPMHLPLYWMLGRILWGVLIGITLAYSCRMLKKDCCA